MRQPVLGTTGMKRYGQQHIMKEPYASYVIHMHEKRADCRNHATVRIHSCIFSTDRNESAAWAGGSSSSVCTEKHHTSKQSTQRNGRDNGKKDMLKLFSKQCKNEKSCWQNEKDSSQQLASDTSLVKKQVCKAERKWFQNFEQQDKPDLLVIRKNPLHKSM